MLCVLFSHWALGLASDEKLQCISPTLSPSGISYVRLQPNTWSGAFRCWGVENREASLRVCSPPGEASGFASNFEIKCSDAMANPYNVLAAVIAAGMDGLSQELSLPEPISMLIIRGIKTNS